MEETIAGLETCLPPKLRGPTTTITRVAAGQSGAGVYRVEAGGQAFVLKISADEQPLVDWQRRVHIQQLAADSGLAPRILHVDQGRRAVLSDFVIDRSFPAFFADPRTRESALALLGRTLRRVHQLPLPVGAAGQDPRDLLAETWSTFASGFPLPAFVGDTVERLLGEQAPAVGRAPVLSHNDVNPTNLAYDGEQLFLLDWDTAGKNDPFYDLAAVAVFLRMDDETCQGLLAAYDAEPSSPLPARFNYDRRLAAVLCGTIFLRLARHSGHSGASGTETLESTAPLVAVYQRLRSRDLDLGTAEGRWSCGLALVKASAEVG
jgi:aminoglycoside phosphotransferase (APT) family kinase protein